MPLLLIVTMDALGQCSDLSIKGSHKTTDDHPHSGVLWYFLFSLRAMCGKHNTIGLYKNNTIGCCSCAEWRNYASHFQSFLALSEIWREITLSHDLEI